MNLTYLKFARGQDHAFVSHVVMGSSNGVGNAILDDNKATVISTVQEELIIFPNPTASQIRFNSMGCDVKDISIYDLFGRKIPIFIVEENGDNIVLDVKTYMPGVYILNLKTKNNEIINQKFTKL